MKETNVNKFRPISHSNVVCLESIILKLLSNCKTNVWFNFYFYLALLKMDKFKNLFSNNEQDQQNSDETGFVDDVSFNQDSSLIET